MPTPHRSGCDDYSDGVPVYILAGGRSRRFGSDKALAKLDGAPLIVRIADALEPVARSVTVVAANAGKYRDLKLRTIGDVVHASGPIGGVLTAIDDYGQPGWIFISACDWVGICASWVSMLIEALRECGEEGKGKQAVVFRSRQLEPLFGFYHCSIEGVVKDQIGQGNLKMQDLLSRISTVAVAAPPGWASVRNVNYRSGLN